MLIVLHSLIAISTESVSDSCSKVNKTITYCKIYFETHARAETLWMFFLSLQIMPIYFVSYLTEMRAKGTAIFKRTRLLEYTKPNVT